MTRLFMDTRPLGRSPEFRRFWLGSALSAIGTQMTTFAVALQVFTITHSAVAVGGVGLASGIPVVVVGLLGGSLIDAVDRRKLVLLTSGLLAIGSATFAILAFAGVNHVWLLYALVMVQASTSTVNGSATRTFAPRLLPPELLSAGAALTVLTFNLSVIVGPPIAGLITGAWGLRGCYVVDFVSYGAALYAVFRLPEMRPQGTPTRPGLRSVAAGLRFIKGHKVITGAFLADMNATVLGIPHALFPAINAQHFGGDPKTLGLLGASPAIGGLLGSMLSGPIRHVSRQGLAMLVAGGVWGVGVLGFGLAPNLGLAMGFLALAGAADSTSVVCWTAMVQTETPDEFRGRVAAAEFVVGAGGPQLGNFRAGAIGSLTTPATSAIIGGASVIGGAVLIGLLVPALVRYRATTRTEP